MSRYRYPVRPESAARKATHPMLPPRAAGTSVALPTSGVLRAAGVVPSAFDQGQEGSCTANAWSGGVMTARARQAFAAFTPARQYLYARERIVDGDLTTDAGANVGDGATVLSTFGVCHEATWPYTASDEFTTPSPAADAEAAACTLASYTALSNSIEAVLEALAAGHPVPFGFNVYDSFEATGPGSIAETGMMVMPGSSETLLGGHCVLAIDYDLTAQGSGWTARIADDIIDFITGKQHGEGFEGYLWVLNSWGPSWGPLGGQFKMPFEVFLKLAFDPYAIGGMKA